MRWFWRRSAAGFTLIELMVVVGVIGILTTLGVQQWGRAQRRSYQGEAKTNLASGYAAQKNFHARYSAFNPSSTDEIGWKGSGRTYYNYHICWPPPNTRTVSGFPGTPGYSHIPQTGMQWAWTNPRCASWPDCGMHACDAAPHYATNNPQSFEMFANVVLCSGCPRDVWAIDNNKNLRNTSDGSY